MIAADGDVVADYSHYRLIIISQHGDALASIPMKPATAVSAVTAIRAAFKQGTGSRAQFYGNARTVPRQLPGHMMTADVTSSRRRASADHQEAAAIYIDGDGMPPAAVRTCHGARNYSRSLICDAAIIARFTLASPRVPIFGRRVAVSQSASYCRPGRARHFIIEISMPFGAEIASPPFITLAIVAPQFRR